MCKKESVSILLRYNEHENENEKKYHIDTT